MDKKCSEDLQTLVKVLLVFLIFDFATREFLFQATLPHLKMIEENRQDSLTKVFALVSDCSDKYAYVVIIGATYHLMDVPNAFVVTCTIYTALMVLSLLKSYNHEARPFFVMELTPTKCWLEYGNPSGHSLTSSSLYLTIWDLLCRNYKADRTTRFVSLAVTLFVVFAIAFSRIYHGLHTYNQILSGWALGVFLYVLFCHVAYKQLTTFVSQTHKYSIKQLAWNKGTQVFYTFYGLAIVNVCFGELIHPQPQEWIDHLNKNCKGVDFDISPETENFIKFNLAATVAGSYIGLCIEQRWMGTRKYKHFHKTSPFMTFKRIIVLTLIGCPFLSPIVLCPRTGLHWATKLLLKTVIPVTLGNLYLFSCTKFVGYKLGLINATETLSDDEDDN